MKKTIVVAGNIGVGKSTLAELLGQRLGWQVFPEPVAQNPYLEDFYRDMNAWSFQSQIYFLAHKLRIQQEIAAAQESLLQDRSIYEDAEIFARNLYLQQKMSERDFQTYYALYQSLCEFLTPPDLVIYLQASTETLLKRIAKRNRSYEKQIPVDYLQQLNNLYDDWIDNFTICPILIVPGDNLDFVAHSNHFDLITNKVNQILAGKEEITFDVFDMAAVKKKRNLTK